MGEEGTGDEITRTAILRGVVAWLVGQRPGRVRAGAPPTHSTDVHFRADDSRGRFGSRKREQETRSIGRGNNGRCTSHCSGHWSGSGLVWSMQVLWGETRVMWGPDKHLSASHWLDRPLLPHLRMAYGIPSAQDPLGSLGCPFSSLGFCCLQLRFCPLTMQLLHLSSCN